MFKRDDAVSPVIGVILMVAITVILAAVIAAFVFGMAGNVQKTKNVAFVSELRGETTALVTNHGGQDVGQIQAITVNNNDYTASLSAVGSSVAVPLSSGRVVVVVKFTDGSENILLDRSYTT
ncbi:MAG: type IV pilin [Methanomicrobiales archaeon]|nr:type IV pilin [Methanomicrobiales archaeon]